MFTSTFLRKNPLTRQTRHTFNRSRANLNGPIRNTFIVFCWNQSETILLQGFPELLISLLYMRRRALGRDWWQAHVHHKVSGVAFGRERTSPLACFVNRRGDKIRPVSNVFFLAGFEPHNRHAVIQSFPITLFSLSHRQPSINKPRTSKSNVRRSIAMVYFLAHFCFDPGKKAWVKKKPDTQKMGGTPLWHCHTTLEETWGEQSDHWCNCQVV